MPTMKITILAVASALSIIAGTAFAGEGNGIVSRRRASVMLYER